MHEKCGFKELKLLSVLIDSYKSINCLCLCYLLSDVLLTSLSHTVESGEVNSQTARNPLTLRVQMTARNVGVAGEGLWRLKAFGSRNDDGSGERIGEVNQVNTISSENP